MGVLGGLHNKDVSLLLALSVLEKLLDLGLSPGNLNDENIVNEAPKSNF